MRKRLVGVLAALVFIFPNGLQAQSRSWINQCTPGAMRACASVGISLNYSPTGHPYAANTTWIAGASTIISIRLENLQGSRPYLNDRSIPYWLEWVTFGPFDGLEDVDISPVWGHDGFATPWGNTGGQHWSEYVFWGSGGTGSGNFYESFSLWGCNLPDGWGDGPYGGWFWGPPHPVDPGGWTCNGSFTHSFYLPGRWDLSDFTAMQLVFGSYDQYGFPNGSPEWGNIGYTGSSCTTGLDCITVAPVPEPTTLILLGGGLLGFGAAAMRRRRREGFDT